MAYLCKSQIQAQNQVQVDHSSFIWHFCINLDKNRLERARFQFLELIEPVKQFFVQKNLQVETIGSNNNIDLYWAKIVEK
jgi:hypothetical protein